jgi:histidinol dehydrogenase
VQAPVSRSAIRIIESSDSRSIERVLHPHIAADQEFERRVRRLVERVRRDGDRALVEFARRFDGVSPPLELSAGEIRAGAARAGRDVRRAIAKAAGHVACVARYQLPRRWKKAIAPGVVVEQRLEALARVGCYVPGGRFPLPSSLLMTAVPARVAGAGEIVVACPRPEPAVMAAALEAGVTRLFRVGGAHAIAALAYGTATVPRVDKIVGPGNRYVAAAKALVARDCAIDFYAGPTEIAIVAGSGRAEWIAADLVAQAEHDPDARALFITWNRVLARRVAAAAALETADGSIAARALSSHGAIIITRSDGEAIELANRIAPEHLVLESEALAKRPLTAGSIFIGPMTAQAAGDYAIGSNHVLPTAGAARFRGGLSAADFVRVVSVQRLTRAGLARLAPTIVTLARAEGLEAHADSIKIRFARSI